MNELLFRAVVNTLDYHSAGMKRISKHGPQTEPWNLLCFVDEAIKPRVNQKENEMPKANFVVS